jgi:Putative transposase
LIAHDRTRVTFQWKDYARGNQWRTMTLTAMEFLRRFVQHVLPRGFVRIRQFGYLASACRTARLVLARGLLRRAVPPATILDTTGLALSAMWSTDGHGARSSPGSS